jgi:hypothetical protein
LQHLETLALRRVALRAAGAAQAFVDLPPVTYRATKG